MQNGDKKVWIVGGPGTGKSTLSQELGTLYQCPTHDLDDLTYVDGRGGIKAIYMPLSERLSKLKDVLSKNDSWVFEGIYLDWTKVLADEATTIIWLDMPLYLVWFRVVRRHIQRSLAGTNKYKGIIRLLIFLFWIGRYQYYWTNKSLWATRKLTKNFLKPYQSKIIHCKSTIDVKRVLIKLQGEVK